MKERAVCKRCGVEWPITEFVKSLGKAPLVSWNLRCCKKCLHVSYLERYANKKQHKRQLDASKNWKKKNPEKHAALAREYRRRNNEKIIAQNRLNYAIRKGNILRQPCEICGTNKKVHAHHISYRPEDWYNIKWLCYQCHKLEHHD